MSKRDFNGAEVLVCSKCKVEFELYYSDDYGLVSGTNCKCKSIKRIDGKKPLDYFFYKLRGTKWSKSGKK